MSGEQKKTRKDKPVVIYIMILFIAAFLLNVAGGILQIIAHG